jgi:hypothetical protein
MPWGTYIEIRTLTPPAPKILRIARAGRFLRYTQPGASIVGRLLYSNDTTYHTPPLLQRLARALLIVPKVGAGVLF